MPLPLCLSGPIQVNVTVSCWYYLEVNTGLQCPTAMAIIEIGMSFVEIMSPTKPDRIVLEIFIEVPHEFVGMREWYCHILDYILGRQAALMKGVVHNARVHEVVKEETCNTVEGGNKVLVGIFGNPEPTLYEKLAFYFLAKHRYTIGLRKHYEETVKRQQQKTLGNSCSGVLEIVVEF
jgi:hypothetical protein